MLVWAGSRAVGAWVRGQRVVGRSAALLLLTCVVTAPGCGKGAPDKPPPDKTKNVDASFTGTVYKVYDGNLAQCIAAVKAALQTLGLKVVDESGAIFKKSLDAESQDGTAVGIVLTEMTKTTTRVGIKVGRFKGDTDSARRIHSEIESELHAGGKGGGGFGAGVGGFSGFGQPQQPPKGAAEGPQGKGK
jgi:hypothetical protein